MIKMIEESEGRDIKLKPIARTIVWTLAVLILFFFYEAMAREFSFFDEFSVFYMLLVIAIILNKQYKQNEPITKRKTIDLLAKRKQAVLKDGDKELAMAFDEVMTNLVLSSEE